LNALGRKSCYTFLRLREESQVNFSLGFLFSKKTAAFSRARVKRRFNILKVLRVLGGRKALAAGGLRR
jgi:hypothetical protein